MLSTSSCFKTLIRENLTRQWAVPVVGLLGFLLTGMLPMLISYTRFEYMAEYAASVVKGSSFVMNEMITILAVVASAAVFGYLHNPVSSNTMHSMPVKRSGLFGAAYVSGWIMTALPIVVFAPLLMIMRGAKFSVNANKETLDELVIFGGKIMSADEIFTIPHILGFIVTSLVVATFVYTVACLAAVLSGRTLIHVLLAFFLVLVPTILVGETEIICDGYLFGFSGFDINYGLLGANAYAISKGSFSLDPGYLLYYLALSAAMAAISVFIYRKIKLERIGNATTFPVTGDILAALLTIIITLGFSHMLAWLGSDGATTNAIRFAVISVISSAAFYIVMRMIADSSFAVFNLKNLAKYGICFAIIAVILVFTAFDITGYGRRVPAAAEVASVRVETGFPQGNREIKTDFDDAGTIKLFANLQQAAIEEKDVKADDDSATESFTLEWTLKNGKKMKRTFEAQTGAGFKKTRSALKDIYDSEIYKKERQLETEEEIKKIASITYFMYGDSQQMEGSEYIRKEDYKGLLDAVSKDLSGRSFDSIYTVGDESDNEAFDQDIDIEIQYMRAQGVDEIEGRSYYLKASEGHTREFLKSKGYIK